MGIALVLLPIALLVRAIFRLPAVATAGCHRGADVDDEGQIPSELETNTKGNLIVLGICLLLLPVVLLLVALF